MILIVGLGNPGLEYSKTRHNVGQMVVDKLQKLKLPREVIVKKSDVFMNESGSFVKRVLSQYRNIPISSLYVIHDDLDIPLGSYKIQLGRGPKDHKGLESIDRELGTDQYWYVRIGVDNRDLNNRTPGEEYVLRDFTEEERKIIDGVIRKVCKEISHLLQ